MYTLERLIEKASQELLDSGFKESTVKSDYRHVWKRLVRKHGKDAPFEEEMIHKYCLDYFKRDVYSTERCKLSQEEKKYIKAFERLLQVSNGIPIVKNHRHNQRKFTLSSRSQSLLDGYLDKCKNDCNSYRTLQNKEMRIKRFLIDSDFDNLTKETCLEYLENRRKETKLISYSIEIRLIFRFLLYCYGIGEIDKQIINIWPKKFPNIQDKTIPSTYSVEEIRTLLEESKNYTNERYHLRNYAILCLIAYTGIRCADVCNLTFNCFDWVNNTITIVQQKNSKQVVFPLIPELGNPIIEYILHERPDTSERFVFLSEKKKQFTTQSISGIIRRYVSASSIDIGDRHYSAHALRHSLATNLINHSVPVFTIANTLGHSNTNCVHIYAKVNIDGLRKCVLEVPCNA